MLISHVDLYLKLYLLTLFHLSIASNSTNHLLIVSPIQVGPSVNTEANHNSHHQLQSHSKFDPNLFELLDEDSVHGDQSASSSLSNSYDDPSIVDRTAEDVSPGAWSRLSSNVVRVFSPARLSSRLNQG